MTTLRPICTWLGMMAIGLSASASESAPPVQGPKESRGAEELFVGKIGTLLKEKCLACHGEDPKKLRGGLDLRSREAMLRGGESGEPSVVPGKPDESPLYLAVTREDPTIAMPPKENDRVLPEDVAAVRSWIEGGAPWPSADRVKELAGSY